jgi:lipopolysaccharide biosynthesis glycosyltransferase
MIGAGIARPEETFNISITPNPSNGMLSVNGIGTVGEALTVMVFDTYGKLLLEKENDGQIDLSAFTNGIYLVSLKHGNQKLLTKRIVLIK